MTSNEFGVDEVLTRAGGMKTEAECKKKTKVAKKDIPSHCKGKNFV